MARTPPAGSPAAPDADKPKRLAQIRAVYKLAYARDRRLPLLLLGPGLGVLAVFVGVGVLIGHLVYLAILGVLTAVVLGTTIFGRRANAAVYAQVEGQPGAAAAILQSMRGDWRVTPAVAVTRNYEFVHRAIGRPGVLLVGEGAPARVRELLGQEKKRISRVAPETPIYDVSVGDADGQITLRKLQAHVAKLPRNLRPKQVDALEARLRALGAAGPPMPKGPLPRPGRMPRGRLR
ncbi:MAG TPA: DUF4191 domain-containing protein [Mycobacteriales bacterium]|nr:DUF4191 domain-containing protein [Mycobacteriales bacterium]